MMASSTLRAGASLGASSALKPQARYNLASTSSVIACYGLTGSQSMFLSRHSVRKSFINQAVGTTAYSRAVSGESACSLQSAIFDPLQSQKGTIFRQRRGKQGETGARADASDDVPAFKGFPPMTEKPKFWWRILALIPYLLPSMEGWMYAETAYNFFGPLEIYEYLTYPIMTFIGSLPGWFLIVYFFTAYLGVVRNNRFPHFLRFHVVNGMLMEILLQVVGTCNDWIPTALYWGKIGGIFWTVVAISFIVTVFDCIRCALSGMYADVPFLCDAAYLQIPYET